MLGKIFNIILKIILIIIVFFIIKYIISIFPGIVSSVKNYSHDTLALALVAIGFIWIGLSSVSSDK